MDLLQALMAAFRAMGGDFSGGAQPPSTQESGYDELKRKEKEFTLKQKMAQQQPQLQPYQMQPPPLIDPNYPPVR